MARRRREVDVVDEEPFRGCAGLRSLRSRETGVQLSDMPSCFWSPTHVRSLACTHTFKGHDGCVNTVCWTDDGRHILTGSDDRRVAIWDARSRRRVIRWDTRHHGNVFCARLLAASLSLEGRPVVSSVSGEIETVDGGGESESLRVVTCAGDGGVRLHTHTNARMNVRVLGRHAGRAHKLALRHNEYDTVLSAGEDGKVRLFDLRMPRGCELMSLTRAHVHTRTSGDGGAARRAPGRLPLYIVDFSPRHPCHVLVAGADPVLRVLDVRFPSVCVCAYTPAHMRGTGAREAHITGAQWNHDGSRIVVSYNDEHAYVFVVDDSSGDVPGDPVHPSATLGDVTGMTACDLESEEPLGAPAASRFVVPDDEWPDVRAVTRTFTQPPREQALRVGETGAGTYYQRFMNHRNDMTVKGIAFMGPRSEYVVSGCDSGHVWVYSADTGAVVNMMKGDNDGAVNCLSPHPLRVPALLTSGLEDTAKLWEPSGACTFHAGRAMATSLMNTDARRMEQYDTMTPPFLSMLHLALGGMIRTHGSEEAAAAAAHADRDGDEHVLETDDVLATLLRAYTMQAAARHAHDGDDSGSDSEASEDS